MAIFAPKRAPPNRSIYEALGELVYAFNALEAMLLQSLVFTLGGTEEADIVVAGLSFNQALDRFSILFNEFLDKNVDGGTAGFCSHVAAINDERNRHIHGHWGFWGSGQPSRRRKRLKRGHGVDVRYEGVDPSEVRDLAARLNAHAKIVYEATRDLLKFRQSQPALPRHP
ncbi:MAG TPA: hypothetical protein VF493_00730 [Terriglobales bacterium]